MRRFLAVLGAWLFILSGVLLGCVYYARYDADYSCLSFDNLTIQLDGSIYRRRLLPVQWAVSPDLEYGIALEEQQGPDLSSQTGKRQIVLTSRIMGERIILDANVAALQSEVYWSPDGRYVAYAWSQQIGKPIISIVSLEGKHLFVYQTPPGQQANIVGWSGDGRYFMLRYRELPDPYASTFLTVDLETLQTTALYREHPGRLYSDLGRIQAAGLNHFAFFDGREIVLLDLVRQEFLAAPVTNVSQLASLRWSPDDQYLAVSYNELIDTEPNNREFRENVTRILEINDGGAAETGRTRAWPQLGTTPQLRWSPNNRYLFMESTDTITRNTRLLVYDRERNRTESIAFPLRYFTIREPYLIVISDSSDHQTSRLEIRNLETLQMLTGVEFPRENLMAYFRLESGILSGESVSLIQLPFTLPYWHRDFFLLNRVNAQGIVQRLLLADFDEAQYGNIIRGFDRETLWFGFPQETHLEIQFLDLLHGTVQQFELPHPEVWRVHLIPLLSREDWLVILLDARQNQLFLYRINLSDETVTALPSSPYQGVSDLAGVLSLMSPDQRSIMIPAFTEDGFQPLIFELKTQAFYSPGVFPNPGSLPAWTECNY